MHGIILDFLENRQKETIIAYFKAKDIDFCNQIKVLSSDMWDAYSTLTEALFPNAISPLLTAITFLFILVKPLIQPHRRFDCKSLRKDFPDEECFKYLRWTLLKSPDDLSEDEQKTLNKAFLVSPDLQKVYQLRQDLKAIFDMDLTKD